MARGCGSPRFLALPVRSSCMLGVSFGWGKDERGTWSTPFTKFLRALSLAWFWPHSLSRWLRRGRGRRELVQQLSLDETLSKAFAKLTPVEVPSSVSAQILGVWHLVF